MSSDADSPSEESKSKSDGQNKEIREVKLKTYSKLVMFYPLLIFSVIAMLIQLLGNPDRSDLAIAWAFILFLNLIIVGFDFPTVKFFILVLVVIIVAMIIVILDNTGAINVFAFWVEIREFFDVGLDTRFYAWMVLTFGFLILAAVIQAQFEYVVIEKNELYVHKILRAESERYPTSDLRVKIELVDIFEFITMGTGSIELIISGAENYKMDTIPFVKIKKKKIDEMLSATLIETEES